MLVPLIIISIASIVGITSYYFLGSDNPVEEACEEVIKEEIGKNVDLTPSSVENKGDDGKAVKAGEVGNKAAS